MSVSKTKKKAGHQKFNAIIGFGNGDPSGPGLQVEPSERTEEKEEREKGNRKMAAIYI